MGKGRFSSSIVRCTYYSGSDLPAMSESGNNKSGHQRLKHMQNSKCKHSSDKALLKHTCMLRWNAKEQVWARTLELHFHYSTNPYWRDLWKTFYTINTYDLNHPSCMQSRDLTGKVNSQLAPLTGFLLGHRHHPHTHTPLYRQTAMTEKSSLEEWLAGNESFLGLSFKSQHIIPLLPIGQVQKQPKTGTEKYIRSKVRIAGRFHPHFLRGGIKPQARGAL